jgi:hypothetical protein
MTGLPALDVRCNAAGTPAVRSMWDSGDLGIDPHRAHQDSAAAVTAAFATPDDHQIEVRESALIPGQVAIGVRVVDVLDFEQLLGLLGRSPWWTPPC